MKQTKKMIIGAASVIALLAFAMPASAVLMTFEKFPEAALRANTLFISRQYGDNNFAQTDNPNLKFEDLSLDDGWGNFEVGHEVKKGELLFPRIEE